MKISYLSVKNFRNHLQFDIFFNDKTNILIGNNAVGKTNLIEAIYYLSLSKSFRTKIHSQLINFNHEFSSIEGHITVANRNRKMNVVISDDLKKYKIDGVSIQKVSEFIGICNVVLFIPDDLNFIKGSPKYRRKFLDNELSKISPIYVYLLNKYHNILKEKNTYLKSNTNLDLIYLDILDEQLSKLEVDIISKRLQFIHEINNKVKNIHDKFSDNNEVIHLSYSSFINSNEVNYDAILLKHKNNRSKDIKYKHSLIGIHKDDIEIYINQKNANDFCSQGQQRTIVLSIKIALIEVIKDNIGEYPILLLDDVLSELDDQRKTMLLDLINNRIQTFITTTSIDGIKHQLLDESNKIYINKNESEVS